MCQRKKCLIPFHAYIHQLHHTLPTIAQPSTSAYPILQRHSPPIHTPTQSYPTHYYPTTNLLISQPLLAIDKYINLLIFFYFYFFQFVSVHDHDDRSLLLLMITHYHIFKWSHKGLKCIDITAIIHVAVMNNRCVPTVMNNTGPITWEM